MTTVDNPYQPPTTESVAATDMKGMVLASKGQRLGTLIIDYIGFMVLSFGIGVFVAFLGEEAAESIQQVPDFMLGLPIFMGYYCFFEGIWGRTPGKFLIGTKVVDEEGEKPSFGQIVGRSLCRMIPFEAFSFLGSRGWHDSISHTYVVRTRIF